MKFFLKLSKLIENYFLKITKFFKNFLAYLALISLILEQFIFVASATAQALPIVPDGSTATQITQTASGIDQINIASPNVNGLSHNKFDEYNVNVAGQVINNFSGKNPAEIFAGNAGNAVTQTQIAGLVIANPNLNQAGSAKIILNEVTSGNVSQLLGYTEIAGTKADLILANPNGITCKGCGFINTARLLMVAGKSDFDANGNLGFNLKEQIDPNLYVPLITIDGLGLDATRVAGTEIIASSVKLLASIYGSENNSLMIKTGDGKYDYASKNIDSINSDNVNSNSQTSPIFAIDASALAKIQAGQIYLIATKRGVGVKMANEILASQTLNLEANGDIYYQDIAVGGEANLKSSGTIQNIDSNASILAPNVHIQAENFNNSALISAYNLNIKNGENLTNSGNLEALNLNLSNINNINNSGSIFGQNSLNIAGTNLTNNSLGTIYSSQDYSINLTGLLINSGLISSENNLNIQTNQLTNNSEISAQNNLTFLIADSATNSGNLIAVNALNFSANSLTNSGATQSNGVSTFNLSSLTNQKNAIVYSKDSLNINIANNLKNFGKISALNDLIIAGNSTISNYSKILANGDLTISANSLRSGSYGMISLIDGIYVDIDSPDFGGSSDAIISSLDKSLNLSLNTNLQNFGELSSSDALSISSPNFANHGNIIGSKKLNLSASFDFFNGGNIKSNQDVKIDTPYFHNYGLIDSLQRTIINAKEISNQTDGVISSTNDLALTSTSLNNLGVIYVGNNFIANSETFNNSGNIYSANNFNITNVFDLTNSGNIYADNAIKILANNITNSNLGLIYGNKDVSLITNFDFNNFGNFQTNADLALSIGNNTKNSGIIIGKQITLNNVGDVANSGSIEAENNINFSAKNLANLGAINSLGNANFNLSENFTNHSDASIYAKENLTLNVKDSLNNSGEISALGSSNISSNNITNSNKILSNGVLSVSASSLNNNYFSTIASLSNDVNFTIKDDFINNGQISSAKNLAIFAKNFANFSDVLAGSKLITTIANQITNSGNLQSVNDFSLTAKSLENSGSIRVFGESLINADSINNQSNSLIFFNSNSTINSADSFINSGAILANEKLDLNTNFTTNLGEIFSAKDLKLNLSNSFTNVGTLSSLGSLDITSNSSIINNNQILSDGNLNISAINLNNADRIQANGDIALNLTSLTNSNKIISGGNFNIKTAGNVANNGNLESANNFVINATKLTNSPYALILAKKDLTLQASSIVNQNTKPSNFAITSGLVSAVGTINFLTDNLNNNGGLIASTATTLKALNAPSVTLNNEVGSFVSTEEINLNLGALDYTITGNITASNIDITANNIFNRGNVTASDFIKLNATGSIGNSGGGTIVNGVANGDNSNILLASGSYINFLAKNNIENYGKILGSTDLTLTSTYGNINNYNNGKITTGSGLATINAVNGAFNNNAQTALFTANNNAIFNAKNLNNFGEISVANDLTTNITNNLTNNPTALIWSGRDAIFNVANIFLNNQADIYADRNLTIQKNTSLDPAQNKTNLVQNISGSLETYSGDIKIKAVTLENKRSSMKTQGGDYVYGQAYVRGGDCHRNWRGKKKCNPTIYRDLHAANIYGIAGLEASVLSGGGINITANNFLNDASSIISSANFGINTTNFNNNSYSFVQYNDNYRNYEYYTSFIKSGGALTITQNGALKPSLINGSNVASFVAGVGNSKQVQSTKINHIDNFQLAKTGILAVDLSSIINAINNGNVDKISADLNVANPQINTLQIARTAVVVPTFNEPSNLNLKTSEIINPNKISTIDPIASISASNAVDLTPNSANIILAGNFKINLDPSATTPLVESRSQFTDASKFFGSSYYFEKLGLNKPSTRILGDAFIENKLILDQLRILTNDSLFLNKNINNSNLQIKELLDNSIEAFLALGLDPNEVALNGLNQDQINSLTKDIITFEATKVNGISVLAPKIYLTRETRNRLFNANPLTGGKALANSSTLFAKENLTIDSPNAQLLNNGSIVSDLNLTLNLDSLVNKTKSISQAQIIAGNNLSITAQNGDIKNIGAKIGAIGSLSLEALKGNILNTAIVQTNDQNLLNQNPDSYQLGFNNIGKISGNISSTLLQDASIKAGSIAINAGGDFDNLGATISTVKNISADGLNTSSGNIAITAGGDINIATLQLRNREETAWGYKKKGGTLVVDETKNFGSDVESAGSLSLRTTGLKIDSPTDSTIPDLKSDINIIGSDIASSGNMNLVAKDDVNILSAIDIYHKEEKSHKKGFTFKKSYEAITDETKNLSSNLTSGGDINISSGNDTNILASNLTGAGNGDILVGAYTDLDTASATYGQTIYNDNASLNILNGVDTKRLYLESTKTKTGLSIENALMTAVMVAAVVAAGPAGAAVLASTGGMAVVGAGALAGSVNKQKTTKTEIHYDETIVASKLNFGNNLTLSSMNDVNLRATKVEAGGDIAINAVNNLTIATASEAHQTSYDLKDKGNYFFKNGQSGNYNTDVVNTEITSNGGTNSNLVFNVGNATVAQYNKASGDNTNGVTKTGLDGSILYGDFSENSKLAYLDKLDSSKTIYDSVEEINKSWDQTNRGLTKAGQAVVAITATALTMGAMDPVSGSWVQGALVAGTSAAASTASISATNSAMNADGDFSKQLKTISKDSWDNTTSKESVKNIAIASLAGGLTVGLTNVINAGSFVAPATNTASTISNNASTLERIGTNLQNSFQEVAINTVASSASQSAINGDSFSDSLKAQGKNVLIYTLAKVGANEIGRAYHGTTTLDANGNVISKTPPTIGKSEQLLLHAGLGAITSSLTGNDPMSGAIAGVAGELTAEIANENGADVATSIQLANLAGAISSITYGGLTNQSDDEMANNAWEGSRIAGNAGANNAVLVGGKYKIPLTDSIKTADDKDYDLHFGVQGSLTHTSASFGTDGFGLGVDVNPTVGIGGYLNILPHGEQTAYSVTTGVKNSELGSGGIIITTQGNLGITGSYGIAFPLYPSTTNVSIPIPLEKLKK